MTQTAPAPPQSSPKPKRTRRTERIIAQVNYGDEDGENWSDLLNSANSTESARDSIIEHGMPDPENLRTFRIIRIVEDRIRLESRVTIAKPERKRRNNNPA